MRKINIQPATKKENSKNLFPEFLFDCKAFIQEFELEPVSASL